MSWTDSAIIDLTRKWSEGQSAAAIGATMGVTRNAVIGKVHRLGLPCRRTVHRNPNPKVRRERVSKPRLFIVKVEKPVPTTIDDRLIPLEQRKHLIDLNLWHCRWPVHNPDDAEFFFCGAVAVEGKPYCEPHCLRAYHPAKLSIVPRPCR